MDEKRFQYYQCVLCQRWISKRSYTHAEHKVDCLNNFTHGVEFVECQLCDYAALNILFHVRKRHGLTKEEYQKLHGPTKCSATRERYQEANKYNGDWIFREIAKGNSLKEYRDVMGRAVSEAILKNPAERLRRSKLAETTITAWARSQKGRARAAEYAVEKLAPSFKSKIEKTAYNFLCEQFPELDFQQGSIVMNKELFKTTASGKRQVDIISRNHKLIVEIDGTFHFQHVEGFSDLELKQKSDLELNVVLPLMGYTLIRISHDQWKSAEELKPSCKENIIRTIKDNLDKPGVYFIGKLYDQNNQNPKI